MNWPKVVVIYRQRLLEQFASLKLAEQSGVWHVRRPHRNRAIALDREEFEAYAARERRMWRENQAALDQVGAHYLSYEQLNDRPQESMNGVFKYLGVESCPVETWLVRLNPMPLEQKILNFQQFAKPAPGETGALALPLSA